MEKVWIEAALNGAWGRALQPNIPIAVKDIVADGVAAAKAGASIIHLHAYDETTGRQKDDWQIHARIIEGIREKVDAIVYPTVPIAGSALSGQAKTPRERYAHLEELANRKLVEWGVIDPGSVNFSRFEALARGEAGFIYSNPDEHFFEGMRIGAEYGVRPSYAIYEPGCTRIGAAVAAARPRVPTPVYRFMFADEFTFGFPPKPRYLDAHLSLLEECAPGAPWMTAGLGVDIRPLIGPTVERGGHIRVGLEDVSWGSTQNNRDLVEEAAKLVRKEGGEPASAIEVRAACQAIDTKFQRGLRFAR